MPIESKTENLNWTSLQGTMLGAAYLLERFASADQNTAGFDTRTGGERPSRALARLVAADGEAGEHQIQVWQAIKRCGHPHLLPIWGTGRTQADGHNLIYVVLEAADENLAGVLGDRALEPGEAGEILVSIVGALGHLHSQGFVHGCLSPEQVMAVGETVKLSTGGVRRVGSTEGLDIHKAKYSAPESAEGNVTPAADIWCLGATLVEGLTQRACGADYLEEAARLPAPFDAIAKSCLQGDPAARGTLPHMLALYEGTTDGAAAASEIPKQMAAAAGAGGSAVPQARVDVASTGRAVDHESIVPVYLAPGPIVPEADSFSAEALAVAEEAPSEEVQSFGALQSESSLSESIAPPQDTPLEQPVEWSRAAADRLAANAPGRDEIVRAKRRAWIFVAVALAILLAVIWVLRPARSSANRTQVPQKSSSPTPRVKQGQTITLPAAGQDGAPAAVPSAAAEMAKGPIAPGSPAKSAMTSSAGRGPIWRVILYTYHRGADAEKRVAIINSKHPGLGAAVFTPNGDGKAPYLVSIGGSVNHADAAQLRRNALRSGLPRDSYLQNYGR